MKILRANFICHDKREFDVMIIVMEITAKKNGKQSSAEGSGCK